MTSGVTHVRDLDRLANLFSIVILAYTWCYIIGIYIHENIKSIRVLSYLPISVQANMVYYPRFHRLIDWTHPRNLIEKIYWLERYADTSLWTLCADKFAVREYIKAKGCGELLNELYGHWTDPLQIDFAQLPDSFILKTTNGCGLNVKIINNEGGGTSKSLSDS